MADFNKIASKWQKRWESSKIFKVKEDSKKKKFYVLEMYPYPSASYLHMGHIRNYTIGDVYARFKRMKGFNVLYPMGYDSFGLPAETAAKKEGIHPKKYAETSIKKIMEYQKALGNSYDWDRILASHDPDYYRWNQLFFLKLYEKGLAYRKKAPVNWCNKCESVLANEEAEGGKCWRCGKEVVQKDLEQWFFKIIDYADRLLKDLDKIEWPDKIKTMQKNWIGKSKGTIIDFEIENSDKKFSVFTTRPDTFFGITFLVYAPEHPDVMELVKGTKYEKQVKEFVKKVVLEDRFTRTAENKEKHGMFIGKYAINPITKEKIPIYIANFVLYEYGTGAIIAVPAHDQRDFEFAKKYKIPIKVVINPPDYELNAEKMNRAFIGDGIMVNSADFNGMNNREAIPEITKFFEKNKCGKATTQYKIRDWLISRQRYWGTPIPVIHCEKCGVIPVPEKDLPVLLPEKVDFKTKVNPLLSNNSFVNVKCPKCKGKAKRETDTMGGFVDSSWYFLRYCDSQNKKKPFDSNKVNYWMPVDQYVGGAEHAVMHLIYARFFVKALKDLGFVKFDEPFKKLFNQGIVYKDGAKMSKSKGNVVFQTEISDKYGIDTARLFLMFVSSPDKQMEWDDKGVEGSYRFLNRLVNIVENKKIVKDVIKNQESKVNKTIKEVTGNIDNFGYNIALISIMELTNYLGGQDKINKSVVEKLLLLLSPFTPHICEELWEKLGNKSFISLEKWPGYDEKKIDLKIEASEEAVSGIVSDINSVLKLAKIEKPEKITLFVAEKWKYDFFKKVKKAISKTRNIGEIIKLTMDKEHGKEISRLVPRLVKDESRIPNVILEQNTELKSFDENKIFIKKQFNCEIEVVKAEDSKEEKAKQAIPSKPAILVC
ncbi:MAG: leucine--tRNA ligase [Nanoarchaeota archaeon]|nr:leucine--tRNA ligase [Nanoarchaeota archaeon]